jgi:hypothetical protein
LIEFESKDTTIRVPDRIKNPKEIEKHIAEEKAKRLEIFKKEHS